MTHSKTEAINAGITVHMPIARTEHEQDIIRTNLDRDHTAQHLTDQLGLLLHAIGCMRERYSPDNPEQTLAAAQTILVTAQAVQEELILSRMVTLGQVAKIKNIPRPTAQGQRHALEQADAAATEPTVRYSVGYRPCGENAQTWYFDDPYVEGSDLATTQHTVVSIATGPVGAQSQSGTISAPGSVTVTGVPGARTLTTDTRVVILSGQRVALDPGSTQTVEGWHLTGTDTGITGTEH